MLSRISLRGLRKLIREDTLRKCPNVLFCVLQAISGLASRQKATQMTMKTLKLFLSKRNKQFWKAVEYHPLNSKQLNNPCQKVVHLIYA